MEAMTSKDFFEHLNSNTLKSTYYLKGFIKKSDDQSEVLFARSGEMINWVKIPSFMIESVDVLKTYSQNNEILGLVKIHFKIPASIEGEIFYPLISSMERGDSKWGCCSKGFQGGSYGNYSGMNRCSQNSSCNI